MLKMTDDAEIRRRQQMVKYIALLGAILAIVCHYMPPQYQAVCQALAAVCGAR